MLQKRGIISLFEISLLIISIFAFGFIFNTNLVEAGTGKWIIEKTGEGGYNARGLGVGENPLGQEVFSSKEAADNKIFSFWKGNKVSSTATPTPASIAAATKSTTNTFKVIKDLVITPQGGNAISLAKNSKFTLDGNILTYGGKTYTIDNSEINKLVNTGLIEKQAVAGSQVSTLFGKMNWGWGHIIQGATWAVAVVGAIQLLGPIMGLKQETTNTLSIAAGAGIMAGKTAWTLWGKQGVWPGKIGGGLVGGKGQFPIGATGIGIGTAVLVFILLYKETEYRIVTFNCRPWQAPVSGDDCEKCNSEILPCSEYRCKALGQSCELVNPGTEEERCINAYRGDTEPPVLTPDENVLTVGHSYKNVKKLPPGPGFTIARDDSADGCIKAFTPLSFGFTSLEPAQCKIDRESTDQVGKDAFDAMSYWVGGSNLYKYNHTEVFSLPGPANLAGENLTITNDGQWTFFVRCRDFNGNENEAEYAIRFCVDPSPDTTPPVVMATSMENNGYVPADTDKANVDFYINEPSTCKWSFEDQSYVSMENTMVCAGQVYEMNSMLLYTCKTELTGISRDGSDYFIRCKDQPGKPENDRMVMQNSFKFSLTGTTQLIIRNLQPNETIYGSTDPAKIELSVETLFGAENGKSICFYSTTDNDGDYIKFFDTGDVVHKQRQDLTTGDYVYYYKCVDAGGNVAKDSTSFSVVVDTSAPVVARVYEEAGKLKLVTVKNSECAYTFDNCDFTFEEGTNMPTAGTKMHIADWKQDKTYYIKCRDEFKNEEADCAIVVRPSRKL